MPSRPAIQRLSPFPSNFASARISRRTLFRLAVAAAVPLLPRFARAQGSSRWAGGGTASMTAKDGYPNPFTSIAGSCAIVASTTLGPCTTASDLDREDVSEGWSGLPVRLAIRVVDAACTPLPDAVVKIWHTNIEGSYSGQTPNNGMCLQQQAYASSDFFRGVRTTDADGVAWFDTCFPGWYRGRAIHIHFQVKAGGVSYRVSQLFVPEAITEEVFAEHPEYVDYGQPDTSFANDNIMAGIPSGQRALHILDVARMTDGTMLASKTVAVVASGVVATPTPGAASTPTATATATPSPAMSPCIGDCSGDASVTVDELITHVNIAMGDAPTSACVAIDRDASGSVTVDEIVAAVNAALSGCS